MSNDKIDVRPTNAAMMERPAFIPVGDTRGTDHITKDDLRLPRLALAQGITLQVAEGKNGVDANGVVVPFITGVMFNSFTEEIYGKGPLDFFIIRGDKPRGIEFFPRETGGGVKDMNVPLNDRRMQFRPDPEHPGQSLKPLATKFYDYIICMLPLNKDPMKSVISLSFKSSGLKVATGLNLLIKYRNAPLFAGVYRINSIVDPNRRKGIFNNFNIENAGWIVDEELYKIAESLYTSLADKQVTIDREGQHPEEDADEFDAEKLEREAQASQANPM